MGKFINTDFKLYEKKKFGAQSFFPEVHEEFVGGLTEEEKEGVVDSFHDKLFNSGDGMSILLSTYFRISPITHRNNDSCIL